jgi:hypothetical protein
VVLSGGNIDSLLSRLLRHGMAAAARYLHSSAGRRAVRSRWPNCSAIWPISAQCVGVGHERLAPRLQVYEAEVVLVAETRALTHCEGLIGAFRSAGYTPCIRLTFTGYRSHALPLPWYDHLTFRQAPTIRRIFPGGWVFL